MKRKCAIAYYNFGILMTDQIVGSSEPIFLIN